jgi:hypothetical protein
MTSIRTAVFIGVTALIVGSAVGPRLLYAQTPAQMEYERQAREARQAEERRQQEQQRLQQLQNDNARRQQEETNRGVRALTPGSQSPQSAPGSTQSGSTGAGAAQPASVSACKAKPVRGAPAAVLLISVGTVTQSGAVKPLVAQGFFLLKDSMDDALTKGGFRPPPGMSPRTGMEHARINNTPNLNQAVAALLANVVCGPVLTDSNGMAQFPPLHTGTYHLVGGNLNPRLAWNLRVDLKSGANSVTLDQRNAAPFDR